MRNKFGKKLRFFYFAKISENAEFINFSKVNKISENAYKLKINFYLLEFSDTLCHAANGTKSS